MLSNTSKYAIRASIYLAVHITGQEKIGIKKISEDLEIPTPFLGKILQTLARNKILSSTKGPNGGFGLGRNPAEVRLLEIIETVDNADFLHLCMISSRRCEDSKVKCSMHARYAKIRDDFRAMLQAETVETLAEDFRQGRQRISI